MGVVSVKDEMIFPSILSIPFSTKTFAVSSLAISKEEVSFFFSVCKSEISEAKVSIFDLISFN